MHFQANIPNAGGITKEAAFLVGAPGPGKDWLFAEGYTAPKFQEYLILANFNWYDTAANVKLMYQNGSTQTVSVTVKALSQYFFDVNYAYAHPQPGCTPTYEVSAEVTTPSPSIVAARLMYFNRGNPTISGSQNVVTCS